MRPPNHRRPVLPRTAPAPVWSEPLEPRRLLTGVGELDPSFGGGDGIATAGLAGPFLAVQDDANAMAVRPDGKIVLAGDSGDGSNARDRVGVARFNPDGSPDPTFNGDGDADGTVAHALGTADVDVHGVALQADGKIVVVGSTTYDTVSTWDWFVLRLNQDGSIDPTFGGGDGLVTRDFGYNRRDTAYAVAVQPDGKIVVTGNARQDNTDLAVVRFNADGTPDATFSGDGADVVDVFGGDDFASDVTVDPDGAIVIAGGASLPGSGFYRGFVLLRYLPNGTPDTTFDGVGKVYTDFGANALARQVLRQPDGKYVVGGLVGSADTTNPYAVARYNADGSLDTTFGTNTALPGTTLIPALRGHFAMHYGIARQADGKLLFGGHDEATAWYDTRFGVVRLTVDGAPDTTFGPGGVRALTTTTTQTHDKGADLAIAPDGQILFAGTAVVNNRNDFGLLKIRATDSDTSPPTVVAAGFDYVTQSIDFTFSEQVFASIDRSDLVLRNLTTGQDLSDDLYSVVSAGQGVPTTASWHPATFLLPDGNYEATLLKGTIADPAGNALAADYTVRFFVLTADANHDRAVNLSDLAILAQNYNRTGQTFAQGDFNGDGAVNFSDLAILAQRYNTTLPPAPAPATPVTSLAASAASLLRAPKDSRSLFSSARVATPPPAKPKPPARPQPRHRSA